jgi:general secretion pathway protein H
LLELLVVLVIVGILLGVVSLNAAPSEHQAMHNEAQRIALLLQLARDEAIVRNRPIAFELAPDAYRFLVRDDAGWQPISGDDVLRERRFSRAPIAFTIDPPVARQGERLRIVFGREPVDKAFLLTLAAGDLGVNVRADGIGHFVVE